MADAIAPRARSPLAPAPGTGRRRTVNRIMEGVSTAATVIAVAVLLYIVISVIGKAAPALSFNFIFKSETVNPFGVNEGGVANAIIGSLILVAIAAAIAVPIAILLAIYTQEFARPSIALAVRFALDVLNGVPTIVTGVFVYGLLVLGHGESGYAGSVALAIVMLPIVARSAQEVLALVPNSLREAGLALGLKRWRIVLRVVLPTAAGGLLTGIVLGVARISGETAPLLLTTATFSTVGTPTDPSHPLPSLPLTIFSNYDNTDPHAQTQAWAASLLLILFVLVLSAGARTFHARSVRKLGG